MRPTIPLVPPAIAGLEPLAEKDESLGHLEACLAEDPSDFHMMRYLAAEYERRGYERRAEAVLSTIHRLKGANGAILLALAKKKLAQQPLEAIDLLLNVLDLSGAGSPSYQWAREKLRELARNSVLQVPLVVEKTEPPKVEFSDTIELPPLEMKKKAAKSAQPNERTALKQSPVKLACAALARDPQNPILLETLASLLFKTSRFEDCIPVYERFVDLQEPSAKTLFCLGTAYEMVDKTAEAKVCFDHLKEVYPNSPLIEELEELSQKENLNSSDSLPVLQPVVVADILAKSAGQNVKDTEVEPISHLSDPMSSFLHHADEMKTPPPLKSKNELLQTFSSYAEKADSSLQQVESVLANSPDNVAVMDWAAFEYFSRGHWKRALELYTSLLAVSGPTEQTCYCLGSIYAEKKRFDKAREFWNLLVDNFGDHRLAAKAKSKMKLLDS